MSFNQGINLRGTSGFVTDAANTHHELGGTFGATYPETPSGGGSTGVGWESFAGAISTTNPLDRNAAVDARLAGHHFFGDGIGTYAVYRIDLPSAGTYTIAMAFGDSSATPAAGDAQCELFDTTTSLGVIIPQTLITAGHFIDATGADRTSASDWVTNNATISKTFATTICRFRIGNQAGFNGNLRPAHIFVAGAAVTVGSRRIMAPAQRVGSRQMQGVD